jgi:sugar lactone lactonase YvrE
VAGGGGSGTILEYTPGGTQSTFATGLTEPRGLAFDSAGNLFEADKTSGNIYEFTPGGVRSTFATGLFQPIGLAFDGAGNLFEADVGSGNIFEFTPGGVRSTFATGLSGPSWLAFGPARASVPDSGATIMLLGAALGMLGVVRRFVMS